MREQQPEDRPHDSPNGPHKPWLRARLRQGVVAGLLALPLGVLAQQAFTRAGVSLMAGPGNSYPVVAMLAQGQPVEVVGCTQGYGWCDVMLPDGARGWLYAGVLNYPYQGNPVPLPGYASVIGVPIIGFSIGSYWGNYYRDRPWYGEPRYWGGRPPPPPPPGWRPPPPRPAGWHPHPGPPPANFRPPQPPAWQQPGWPHNNNGRPPHDPGMRPPPGGGYPPQHGGGRPPGAGNNWPGGVPGNRPQSETGVRPRGPYPPGPISPENLPDKP